jgi:hypothetical protein
MPTIRETLDELPIGSFADIIVDYVRHTTIEEGIEYRAKGLCSIRATLADLLLAPLADMVIGYDRYPECTCYTFVGDTEPYLHWIGCPCGNSCLDCCILLWKDGVRTRHMLWCSTRRES